MFAAWRGWQAAALAAVLATLLPLAMFLVAVWLLGWQLQSVQTASMAPTYPVGSLLVVAQADPAEIVAGTPLVFEDPREAGRLVVHRVVGVAETAQLAFITRGDANTTNDPLPVPARLVRGRVLWHVTFLGGLLDWLQWPRSFIALVLLPGVALLAVELRGKFGRRGSGSSVDSPMADTVPDANLKASSASEKEIAT